MAAMEALELELEQVEPRGYAMLFQAHPGGL